MEDEKVTEEVKPEEAKAEEKPPTAEMPPVPPAAWSPGPPPPRVPQQHNWTLIALIVVSVIAALLLASTIAMGMMGGHCHEGRGGRMERGFKQWQGQEDGQMPGPGFNGKRFRQQLPQNLQNQQNQQQQVPNQQQQQLQQDQTQPAPAPVPTQPQ